MTDQRDRDAAAAVVRHHAQLAEALDGRTEALLALVEEGYAQEAEQARRQLLAFLRGELVPHARAEEDVLYPAAAAVPEGRLLVGGMLGEHRVIMSLVEELDRAASPVRAGATARALAALFHAHLAKENDLVVPLILDSGRDSLADLLGGMHDLLGGGGHDEPAQSGGCGCGGCGCGGDAASRTAPGGADMLTIDPRVDVRDVPHAQRHALVLSALDQLAPGRAVVLVAPHAPMPLLAQIEQRYHGAVEMEWLQAGPDVWQIRLQRVGVRV
ncbi:MAG TPA: DUF2249 domain-containing protein [Micromonosporaceae bacterium]